MILWLIVWWIAFQATTPLLRWPLGEESARLAAAGRYALGALLIPLLIALLSQPDYEPRAAASERRELTLLSVTTAYVGFNSLVPVALIVPGFLAYYAFDGYRLPGWVLACCLAAALLWSHAGAVTVPRGRRKWHTARYTRTDAYFLAIFALFGPLLAAAVLAAYDGFFAFRSSSLLMLWLVVLMLAQAAWKSREAWLPDWMPIALLGMVGLPLVTVLFIEEATSGWSMISAATRVFLLLLLGGQGGLLWAQALRQPPGAAMPGGLLLVLQWTLLLSLVLLNAGWGAAAAVVAFPVWLGASRRYRQRVRFPHPALPASASLAALVVAFSVTALPAAITLGGYGLLTLGLIGWAYVPQRPAGA